MKQKMLILPTQQQQRWFIVAALLLSYGFFDSVNGYSFPSSTNGVNRRQVLDLTLGTLVSTTSTSSRTTTSTTSNSLVDLTVDDQSRMILPNEPGVLIPRVGYSVYKSDASQIPLCIELALKAGIQYFDVASQYSTNKEVGQILKSYINSNKAMTDGNILVSQAPTSKLQRREQLFISHKVSNDEQYGTKAQIKRAIKNQMKHLNVNYLDMCSIHSPLTNQESRLRTYNTLLELQKDGLIRAVGVCNYGVR